MFGAHKPVQLQEYDEGLTLSFWNKRIDTIKTVTNKDADRIAPDPVHYLFVANCAGWYNPLFFESVISGFLMPTLIL